MRNAANTMYGIWALVCLGVSTHAAVQYSFVTDRSIYDALPGDTVPVIVYLQEDSGASGSSALLAEGGLFSAGIKITPLDPMPPDAPTVLDLDDITFAPEFTGGALVTLSPLTLFALDGLLAPPGPTGQEITPGIRRVPIGTFLCTSSGAASATYRVSDFDDHGLSSDTLTWEGTELDNLIAPSEFSIRVVPEPGMPLLLLTLIVPSAMRRRRMRRGLRGRTLGRGGEDVVSFRQTCKICVPFANRAP